MRDRRPCRLCHPRAGSRGVAAGLDQARQRLRRLSARRRTRSTVAVCSISRADENRSLAQSLGQLPGVTSGRMANCACAVSSRRGAAGRGARGLPSRRTPRDRGRRSGRRAGGADGRRPDNRRGRRAAPPRGRSRGRGHGPASCPPQRWSEVQLAGFWREPRSRARRT